MSEHILYDEDLSETNAMEIIYIANDVDVDGKVRRNRENPTEK